ANPSNCFRPARLPPRFTIYFLHSVSFFFKDTATTEIYTLSLHDALPICVPGDRIVITESGILAPADVARMRSRGVNAFLVGEARSEEHTSELQSRRDLVCRLLLEKKKDASI